MKETEILIKQTVNAYDWANKLIEDIPFEKWEITPDTVESNISWQIGHLIVSHYFHSVMVIKGHQMDIIQKIPLKEYSELYTEASPKNSIGKVKPDELLNHLKTVQQKSLTIISSLSSEDLADKLESTPIPHPIAKTKLEAINWNIKHTMYHCGQIGILRRIISERFDFGLRRAK